MYVLKNKKGWPATVSLSYLSVGYYFFRISIVSDAISNSSSVGITTTFTLESAVEIIASSPRTFAFTALSSLIPVSYTHLPVDQAGESPAYQAIADAAKGWIARGVDGLRLDAVKHIYHSETSEENPRFLKMFYEDMNAYYKQKGHTDDFYMRCV